MKMSAEQYEGLKRALSAIRFERNPLHSDERTRWDWLWAAEAMGLVDVSTYYRAGLEDNHIDTGLKRAVRELSA